MSTDSLNDLREKLIESISVHQGWEESAVALVDEAIIPVIQQHTAETFQSDSLNFPITGAKLYNSNSLIEQFQKLSQRVREHGATQFIRLRDVENIIRQHEAKATEIEKIDALDAAIRLYQPELRSKRTNAGDILKAYEETIAAMEASDPRASGDTSPGCATRKDAVLEASAKWPRPQDEDDSPCEICDDLEELDQFLEAMRDGAYSVTDSVIIEASEHLEELRSYLAKNKPVSLIDCAMALQGNERIKLGSDLQVIAKTVLDAAGVKYVD